MSDTTVHGFTAVPRDFSELLKTADDPKANPPRPIKADDMAPPDTPLANAVREYAQKELPKETFHHSMRVYSFGIAFLRYLPDAFRFSAETYLLACLLHDIGTTPRNMHATRLSFEFHGGMIAAGVLEGHAAPQPQNDAVVEAVIRHQDLGPTGKITALGALLQLATVFDNMGQNPEYVHEDTIKTVVGLWPRLKWSGCFASTIRAENTAKPWAHTTVLGEEDFPQGVLNNKLMAPYE